MSTFTRIGRATLLAAACFALNLSVSAKPAHDPSVNVPPMFLVSPLFADLNTTFEVRKTVFEDFSAIATTLTVTLVQDQRGKLSGNAVFRTSKTSQVQNFPLTGAVKLKKANKKVPFPSVTFSVKGRSATSATLSLAGSTTVEDDVYVAPAGTEQEDLASTFTYTVNAKVRGTGRAYTYSDTVEVGSDSYISFFKAPPEVTEDLPQKDSFDYYQLFFPWGQSLAQGSTHVLVPGGSATNFTLRASKFLLVLSGETLSNTFEPDSMTAKLPYGKISWTVAPW